MADDCIFCAIVAGDAPAQIVDSDEHTVSFMDIAPFKPGHELVIPLTHSADLIEISDEDLERTTIAARRLTKKMSETLEPAGFNILNACGAAAWQTVFHVHLHVIPRYEDDPMKLPVIPRGGDPEEIARIAGRIRGDS
jgi:histidine triad (HIT) family protein